MYPPRDFDGMIGTLGNSKKSVVRNFVFEKQMRWDFCI